MAGKEVHGEVRRRTPEELGRLRLTARFADPEAHHVPTRTASPEATGDYRLEGLLPGRWRVSAEDQETGREVVHEIEVARAGSPHRLDFDLGGGGTLTGRVTVNREPLAGLRVLVARPDAGPRVVPLIP